MVTAIELQVISRILTSNDEAEVDKLCTFDSSYYSIFKPQIEFILDYRNKYGSVPSVFNFQMEFESESITLVEVPESLEYLITELKKNKQTIIFREMFNTIKDQGSGDIADLWHYVSQQCDKASTLEDVQPLNVVKQAHERAAQVAEWSQQQRIPTGFAELDKLTYGGLSTVEELLVILGRLNNGKSWVLTRMFEAAQKAGFPVAYYSPEMQGAYLATRFDTWRNHFRNSDLFLGKYDAEYFNYLNNLQTNDVDAFIIEDKHMPEGVSPRSLSNFVKEHNIKLLLIDGISYMQDDHKSFSDHEKYRNICKDLFQMSKKYGCAVVVAAQANRETKEAKDDKGIPFPNVYNIAGSDAIGQIATQVYSIRQIFDKHVLDIRLEKARMAPNENNVLSYSWDVNTGNMQYLPGGADEDPMTSMPSMPESPNIISNPIEPDNTGLDLTDDSDIEF